MLKSEFSQKAWYFALSNRFPDTQRDSTFSTEDLFVELLGIYVLGFYLLLRRHYCSVLENRWENGERTGRIQKDLPAEEASTG